MSKQAPRCFRPLLHAFSEALRETLGRELIGLYVFGSAAFPGFVPESGDIDFITVTGRSPSRKQQEQLDRMHRKLASSFRHGALLDGFYLPLHKARRHRIPDRLAFGAQGRLGMGGRTPNLSRETRRRRFAKTRTRDARFLSSLHFSPVLGNQVSILPQLPEKKPLFSPITDSQQPPGSGHRCSRPRSSRRGRRAAASRSDTHGSARCPRRSAGRCSPPRRPCSST